MKYNELFRSTILKNIHTAAVAAFIAIGLALANYASVWAEAGKPYSTTFSTSSTVVTFRAMADALLDFTNFVHVETTGAKPYAFSRRMRAELAAALADEWDSLTATQQDSFL